MVFLSTMMRVMRRHPFHSDPYLGRQQPAPHKYWKRRRIFMMSAHYYGRARNCYSIAVRYVQRALWNATRNRPVKMQDAAKLSAERVAAGAAEHNFDAWYMREALTRSHVHLNDKSLSTLAMWEPRSFKAVVGLAAHKAMQPSSEGGLNMRICGPTTVEIITNGKL